MSDLLSTTTKKRHNLDSTFKLSPVQSLGFGLQQKVEESAPATKAELWESYQQAKHLNQKGANISATSILPIQAKLTIGQPGDKYEQEADNMAAQVMRMPEPTLVNNNVVMRASDNTLSRKCAACEEDDKDLMRKESEPGQIDENASKQVHRTVQSGGQPLDDATKSFMEPRFGQDFSQVRIHSDAQAAESATSINAHAYTHGHNVVFAAGQYTPATNTGKQLLAHELTHVVQQMGGAQRKLQSTSISIQRDPPPDSAAPVNHTADLPTGSPYAGMDPGLLEKLKHSYLTHFLGGVGIWYDPQPNFEEALNRIGTANIEALAHVYQRANSTGVVLSFIESIRHIWVTTSRGFVFNCTSAGGLAAALDSSDTFCRDTIIGESMHQGKCWREIVSGSPGLHVCLGDETSIHVDMHQTVKGKGGGLNLLGLFPDEKLFTTVCEYDALAVLDHWADLGGSNETIFQRVDRQGVEIYELRKQVKELSSTPKKADLIDSLNTDLNTADLTLRNINPRFRELATRGLKGESDGAENDNLMADLKLIETILDSVREILAPSIVSPSEGNDFEPAPIPTGSKSAYA